MRIAVAGTGYVGLSMAVLLSQRNQVTAVAVSYTHLDVYKRQITRYIEDSKLKFYTFASCIPVSYTHLDVYKRQGWNF